MIKILISALLFFQSSIYSLDFSSLDGETISMSSFSGKKILIVNIATGSPLVNQLSELESLQQLYKDSLVILAFPSNSFAKEGRSNAQIKTFCETTYHTDFLIAAKAAVAGTEVQPVYHWLTSQTENGVMEGAVTSDFQKYLIDETGKLIGVFSPAVSPLDPLITDAIKTTY